MEYNCLVTRKCEIQVFIWGPAFEGCIASWLRWWLDTSESQKLHKSPHTYLFSWKSLFKIHCFLLVKLLLLKCLRQSGLRSLASTRQTPETGTAPAQSNNKQAEKSFNQTMHKQVTNTAFYVWTKKTPQPNKLIRFSDSLSKQRAFFSLAVILGE